MDYLSNFNDYIYDFILRNETSAFELSKKIGVDDSLIAHWQKDRYMPSFENLVKIADYFDVSIDYMLGLSNSPAITKRDTKDSFADRLAFLLKAKNVSAYRLAKDCGIGRAAVSKWLCGRCLPNFENLIGLAMYFNCSTDFLIGRSK